MSYQERLQVFAQKAALFQSARVHERLPDGGLLTGSWRLVKDGESCDCCGTHRLKVVYPLLADGQVFWVGQECLKNLDGMGKVRSGFPWEEPTVEIEGRTE